MYGTHLGLQGTIMGLFPNLGGEVAGVHLSGHLPGHLGRIQAGVFQGYSSGIPRAFLSKTGYSREFLISKPFKNVGFLRRKRPRVSSL